VDLMTVAAVAQEPLLLVAPGTAKSELVLKFKDALRIGDEDYFEYLLTRFTEPSEVLGPIDINLLRQGRYIGASRASSPPRGSSSWMKSSRPARPSSTRC
jgi:MoxR-like ATPase